MEATEFAVLRTFRSLFEGHPYLHRDSSLGDSVANQLYEDLAALGISTAFCKRVETRQCVVNLGNKAVGRKTRRGDGTFGELVPTTVAITREGLRVARGDIANIQIGTETKILAKAMIKQIERVIGDLVRQAAQFRSTGGNPICVALVGINFAEQYTSYEGERSYVTDQKKNRHPIQEAAAAEDRITRGTQGAFDELLFLRFKATNVHPYTFDWLDYNFTLKEYGALLLRVSREYDKRF